MMAEPVDGNRRAVPTHDAAPTSSQPAPRTTMPAHPAVVFGKGEITALTSLRGIAAMLVVLQHFSATMEQHSASPIPSLAPHGYIAVDLFFVLSGFIMAYTYLAGFQTGGIKEFPDFLLKRVARIVPLNVAAIIFVLIAGGLSQALLHRNIFYQSNDTAFDAAANILMLQGIGIGHNLNAPSWSISTEFAAYLVFPALLAIVFGRNAYVLLGAVGVSLTALVVTGLTHHRLGLDTSTIEGGLTRCFAEFILGLAIYRLILNARFRTVLAADKLTAAAMTCTFVLMFLRFDLLTALSFPLLIATLACNRGRVARLFSWRIFHFLGVISFSLYLLHSPARFICLEVLRGIHPAPLAAPVALAAALIGSLLVLPLAWCGFTLIERPGRTFVRQLTTGLATRRRLPAPVTPAIGARVPDGR